MPGSDAALVVAAESPLGPEVLALLVAADAVATSLYPVESNHLTHPEALAAPAFRFLVARLDGVAVGCGAVLLESGQGEIKRVFVADAARGQGVGGAIMAGLEACAVAFGASVLRLETGAASHGALALYRRLGFRERDAFPPYRPDPFSVFMEKPL